MAALSVPPGRAIVRRTTDALLNKTLDLAELARVEVTSEQSLFPIDNVFDHQRGPGGSCWIAAGAGEQLVTLTFRIPQRVASVGIESEERGGTRVQDVVLEVSQDNGVSYVAHPKKTMRFTPYGTTFQRDLWELGEGGLDQVTHLRLRLTPAEGGRAGAPARASLTSVVVS